MKGRRVWIKENLTWLERRAKWKVREAAMEEQRKGAKVWIGNGRVLIEEEWWFWDEEEEALKD